MNKKNFIHAQQMENSRKEYDTVNNPIHYTGTKIDVIDYIEDKKLGFCLGNAIKYISRAGRKQDAAKSRKEKEIEDLQKAVWYINRRIYELETEEANI